MQQEYICILCPRGCQLTAVKNDNDGSIEMSGNFCPRGKGYAVEEMTNPMRTVTTSVYAKGGEVPLVSVKTSAPVPKDAVGNVLCEAAAITVEAPVAIGQVLIQNVAGTGSNLIATRRLNVKQA